jgi:methyl-accepting chemotaxis protein
MKPQTETSESFILAEQARILCSNIKATIIALPVMAVFLTVLLWTEMPHHSLVGWAVFMVVAAFARFAAVYTYAHAKPQQSEAKRWIVIQILTTALAGVGWAWIPLGMLPHLSPDYRVLCMFVVVGTISAAVSVLSAVATAFLAYMLPTAIGLSIFFLLHGERATFALVGMTAVYVALTIRAAKNTQQTIKESLRLRFELETEKATTATLNDDLARKILERQQAQEDIHQSAAVLTDSTDQIMASLSHLAASTAQTATSVTETAATVEEVKQTVYVAGTKATEISHSARQAVEIAQGGAHAAEEAIEGMNRVHAQLKLIAESVLRLGEQTQSIGDVITTVNEVAEQSNLLAVNAAIEAAKAGEQGKGFAIVAQEVRALASQSKQATAQVHSILSDIQKAGAVAVQVTEQGTQAAQAGVQQSSTAGQSIQTLSRSITEAAQVVSQIASSGQQQIVGIDQVVLAMQSIKTASQQNLEGIRQIETAAHNLHCLGQTLRQRIAQYTQSESAAAGE